MVKFSFTFALFMSEDFSHSNSSKLVILFMNFSVAFLTKPYNSRLYLSMFLLSFGH